MSVLKMNSGTFDTCVVSPVCSPSQASEADLELPTALDPAVSILETLF